jgi:hypothetical protein
MFTVTHSIGTGQRRQIFTIVKLVKWNGFVKIVHFCVTNNMRPLYSLRIISQTGLVVTV